MTEFRGRHYAWEYSLQGHGPLLVHLHGWNGHRDYFIKRCGPFLENDYALCCVQLPSFDEGSGLRPEMDALCEDLGLFLGALGHRELYLSGYCLGAVISLDFALRKPGGIKRLVLIEPTLEFPCGLGILRWPWLGPWVLKQVLRSRLGEALIRSLFLYGDEHPDGLLLKLFKEVHIPSSLAYLEMLWGYSRRDHRLRLEEGTPPPMTILRGDKTQSRVKRSCELLCHYFESDLLVQPNAGHFVFESAPDLLQKVLGSKNVETGQTF